jgi:hypothetical protein
MIHGIRSTPHAVARAWPRVPTCAHLAYVVRVPSRVAQQVPLGVRPDAASDLACASVLQVATTPFGVAPTCRSHMHSPRYIHVGAVPSYMHTGPLSRRTVVFSAGRMCSSHPYAALTPPLRRGSALPLRMLLPATSSSPQHPLRRGSVLLLGVEDHLKIKVTQAFTSRPSPRTPFGPYRATPQV